MHFISVIDGSSDCMKLIVEGLEGAGVLRNRSGASFHQLQVIFETDFTGFGVVVKGVF